MGTSLADPLPVQSIQLKSSKTSSRAVRAEALTEFDLYLFAEGTHTRLFDKFGCQWHGGIARFTVWAPNAESVAVVGDWNGWDGTALPLRRRADASGVWEGETDAARRGDAYKYRIRSSHRGYQADKADPFAVYAEVAPGTASRIWDLDFAWTDQGWMEARAKRQADDAPLHLRGASWFLAPTRRAPADLSGDCCTPGRACH